MILFHRYPDLNLEVVALNTREILKQVNTGAIDLGYVFGSHSDVRLEFRPLARVDLEIAVPLRFKSDYRDAGWKQIAGLPWIRPVSLCPFLDEVTALLARKNIELACPVTANDDITKTAFINQGIGATVLERSEAEAFEKKKKIFIWKNHAPIFTGLSLTWLKSGRTRSPVRVLVHTMEKVWKGKIPPISGQK